VYTESSAGRSHHRKTTDPAEHHGETVFKEEADKLSSAGKSQKESQFGGQGGLMKI
jgi:hypothetical protein